jgi:hypothetical protein
MSGRFVVVSISTRVTAVALFVKMKASRDVFHFCQVNAKLSSCVRGELSILKIQQFLKTSMFAGAIYNNSCTTSGLTIQPSLIQISKLMMSRYNNCQKMGWFMTNSSTSQLQRLILKRIKTLLRNVMTNLLLISTPMGLFLTPTSSYLKWINFEILHGHVLVVIPPVLPRHRPLPLELIIIFEI